MEFINAVKSKEKGKIDDALKSFLNTVTVSIIRSLIITKNLYKIFFFFQTRMPVRFYLMSSLILAFKKKRGT